MQRDHRGRDHRDNDAAERGRIVRAQFHGSFFKAGIEARQRRPHNQKDIRQRHDRMCHTNRPQRAINIQHGKGRIKPLPERYKEQ